MSEKILISACLLGEPVRYNGTGSKIDSPVLQKWLDEGKVISVCPELLAGFPIPRTPCEIKGESVIDKNGNDVTAEFIKGAKLVLELVHKHKIKTAILKARSPSCGSKQAYDGSFSGKLKPGMGVTSALLTQAGVQVFNEEEIENIKW